MSHTINQMPIFGVNLSIMFFSVLEGALVCTRNVKWFIVNRKKFLPIANHPDYLWIESELFHSFSPGSEHNVHPDSFHVGDRSQPAICFRWSEQNHFLLLISLFFSCYILAFARGRRHSRSCRLSLDARFLPFSRDDTRKTNQMNMLSWYFIFARFFSYSCLVCALSFAIRCMQFAFCFHIYLFFIFFPWNMVNDLVRSPTGKVKGWAWNTNGWSEYDSIAITLTRDMNYYAAHSHKLNNHISRF